MNNATSQIMCTDPESITGAKYSPSHVEPAIVEDTSIQQIRK